ncbi:hypothetical protein BJ912DRAFT_944829 [Pholiota molesta]|nr:hypothetical protein BJ912DRAFT_944829 [Pholiota molesta]
MLDRFLAGLLHPMIHAGFGVEFSLPGTFAEGLAQAAVHAAESGDLIPSRWFTPPATDLVSKFAGSVRISENEGNPDVHAFSILSRVLKDPELSGFKAPGFQEPFYSAVIQQFGKTLVKYVDQWTLEGDLEKKVQELIWTNALLYAVPGLEPSGQFNADFFLMHHVTSSLFLSELFADYFVTCLAWYIGRGRPQLDIAAFFANPDLAHPTAPGPQPTPHEGVNPSPSAPEAITPNNWLPIIQSLIEYSIHFGLTPAGTFKDTELKDAGLIDGTLFIRAAGLTLNKLGWVREGQAPGAWDFRGFFARSNSHP